VAIVQYAKKSKRCKQLRNLTITTNNITLMKIKPTLTLSFFSVITLICTHAEEPVSLPPYIVKGIGPADYNSLYTLKAQSKSRSAAGTVTIFDGNTAVSAGTRFQDWLGLQPGVMVFDSFGGNDSPKLSIRGSDLGAYPSKKGVKILQDGLPRNFADGSYITSVFSPQAQALEILPSMSSSYPGGTALGGALHFVSPEITKNSRSMNAIYGSHDLWSLGAQLEGVYNDYGIRVRAKHRQQDGWRQHNSQAYSSADIRLNRQQNNNNRYIQIEHTRSQYDVAGPLNIATLKSNPRSVSVGLVPGVNAGPNILRDRPRRDSQYSRIAVRQIWNNPENESHLGVYFSRLDDTFYRPVGNGVEDSLYWDGGLASGYIYNWDAEGLKRSVRVQGSIEIGTREQKMSHNQNSQRGARFAQHRMNATTSTLLVGGQYESHRNLFWDASVQYNYATRKLSDRFAQPANRPGYAAVGPIPASWNANPTLNLREQAGTWRIGMLKKITPDIEFIASGYRTWEPPVFDDMVQYNGGNPNRGPTGIRIRELNPQTANTIEVGFRGEKDLYSWQLTGYRAWVSNEILTLDDGAGTVSSINSTSQTLHTGLEAMLSAQVFQNILFNGDKISFTVVGDWMDFRFKNHSIYGNNALPGVPESRIASEIQYREERGYYALINVSYLPGKTPIDFQNTASYDGYAVWNLRFGQKQSSGFSWFVAVNNIWNKNYTSTAVVLEKLPNATATAYIPGSIRSINVGVGYSW
jgi:iron complex outermembrane recepter protein